MIALDSVGNSCGILICWNDTKYKFKNSIKSCFTLSIQIENEDGFLWWLTAIYGSTSNNNRDMFWNDLANLQSTCNPYWLLTSDINMIRSKKETNAKHLDKTNMISSIEIS